VQAHIGESRDPGLALRAPRNDEACPGRGAAPLCVLRDPLAMLAWRMRASQLSSPAQAGDPVFRDVSDGIEKPRRTGYPACAGYDGSLWSSFVDGQSEACPPSHATWWARRKRLCPPYNQASSSAKADDPAFRGVSDETARPRRTGYSAFAEYDGEWCGGAARLPSNSVSSRSPSPHPETRRPRG
jgi:hypothetical protein